MLDTRGGYNTRYNVIALQSLLENGLISIPAWISNRMPNKVWEKIKVTVQFMGPELYKKEGH